MNSLPVVLARSAGRGKLFMRLATSSSVAGLLFASPSAVISSATILSQPRSSLRRAASQSMNSHEKLCRTCTLMGSTACAFAVEAASTRQRKTRMQEEGMAKPRQHHGSGGQALLLYRHGQRARQTALLEMSSTDPLVLVLFGWGGLRSGGG